MSKLIAFYEASKNMILSCDAFNSEEIEEALKMAKTQFPSYSVFSKEYIRDVDKFIVKGLKYKSVCIKGRRCMRANKR